jgi:hypothetical protein
VWQGPRKLLVLQKKNKEARAGILRRKGLRVGLWESVMKFGYEWISVSGGTPAPPPEKRAPALPPAGLPAELELGLACFCLLGRLQKLVRIS